MLPPQHRLRRASDVKHVRQQGQSWRHPLVVLLLTANEQETSRFAFVASRAVGKAVARNRAKRVLREAVRCHLPQIATGWDCLFIARAGLPQASWQEVTTAVSQLLKRAKMLKEPDN